MPSSIGIGQARTGTPLARIAIGPAISGRPYPACQVERWSCFTFLACSARLSAFVSAPGRLLITFFLNRATASWGAVCWPLPQSLLQQPLSQSCRFAFEHRRRLCLAEPCLAELSIRRPSSPAVVAKPVPRPPARAGRQASRHHVEPLRDQVSVSRRDLCTSSLPHLAGCSSLKPCSRATRISYWVSRDLTTGQS